MSGKEKRRRTQSEARRIYLESGDGDFNNPANWVSFNAPLLLPKGHSLAVGELGLQVSAGGAVQIDGVLVGPAVLAQSASGRTASLGGRA
jgi:hypothetical protein